MGFGRIQSVAGLTDEQARAGALFLTGHARDAEDARMLLEACGLLPYETGEPVKSRAEKSPANKPLLPGQ